MKQLLFYLLVLFSCLLLSSCDYRIHGSINNKTNSDVRIICHLVEKSRWDSLNGPSLMDFESLTGGDYFAVYDINCGDEQFVMIDDSTYSVTLAPDESLGLGLAMNHFWTEKACAVLFAISETYGNTNAQ